MTADGSAVAAWSAAAGGVYYRRLSRSSVTAGVVRESSAQLAFTLPATQQTAHVGVNVSELGEMTVVAAAGVADVSDVQARRYVSNVPLKAVSISGVTTSGVVGSVITLAGTFNPGVATVIEATWPDGRLAEFVPYKVTSNSITFRVPPPADGGLQFKTATFKFVVKQSTSRYAVASAATPVTIQGVADSTYAPGSVLDLALTQIDAALSARQTALSAESVKNAPLIAAITAARIPIGNLLAKVKQVEAGATGVALIAGGSGGNGLLTPAILKAADRVLLASLKAESAEVGSAGTAAKLLAALAAGKSTGLAPLATSPVATAMKNWINGQGPLSIGTDVLTFTLGALATLEVIGAGSAIVIFGVALVPVAVGLAACALLSSDPVKQQVISNDLQGTGQKSRDFILDTIVGYPASDFIGLTKAKGTATEIGKDADADKRNDPYDQIHGNFRAKLVFVGSSYRVTVTDSKNRPITVRVLGTDGFDATFTGTGSLTTPTIPAGADGVTDTINVRNDQGDSTSFSFVFGGTQIVVP